MRGRILAAACLGFLAVGVAAAQAESGSFFKNLLSGGRAGNESEGMPTGNGARFYDPNETYCPTVSIRDGGAAVRAFAGAAGDNTRLRHQITFGRISRECARRADGTVAVRIGVELRALLGPAGAAGSFEAPLTLTVKNWGKALDTRTRRVRVAVAPGEAQGTAAVIEEGLTVPAAQADDYEIEAVLAGPPAKPKAPAVAARRGKAAPSEASAEAPVAAESQ